MADDYTTFSIRVLDEERRGFDVIAALLGFKNVGAYVRARFHADMKAVLEDVDGADSIHKMLQAPTGLPTYPLAGASKGGSD